MAATNSPHDLLPLTPAVFHILLALSDQERHGYGIMKEVETQTDGEMLLRPGTLYQAIKRMLELGLIQESDERPDPALDDQRRRYCQAHAPDMLPGHSKIRESSQPPV